MVAQRWRAAQIMLFVLLATLALGVEGKVYVSIGRKKNSLWRSFVQMFQDLDYVVEWNNSLEEEQAFLEKVLAGSQRAKTTHKDVVVAKYCGTNANCSQGRPNHGENFVKLMQAGIPVIFLEYGPSLYLLPEYQSIKEQTLVVAPNNYRVGRQNAEILCKQTNYSRNILMLHGNEGHIPCAERTRGFKDALNSAHVCPENASVQCLPGLPECANVQHSIVWEMHGGYYRNSSVSGNKVNGQDVMLTMFRVDPTIDAVIACNDDMAIGAVAAANIVRKKYDGVGLGKSAGVSGLFILGMDNISDTAPMITGVAPGPPSFLSTVEWKRQLVDTAAGMVTIVEHVPSRSTLFEAMPNGWLGQARQDSQKNVKVFANNKPWLAELCSVTAPHNCPEQLRKFIEEWVPKPWPDFEFLGIEFGTVWMMQFFWHPTLRATGYLIGFRLLMMCFAIVTTSSPTDFSRNQLRYFRNRVRTTIKMNKVSGWPIVVAFVSSWCASVQVWSRYDVVIEYDQDWSSDTYGLLVTQEFPKICSTGMQESASGIGFLSTLMGFLVVFRFVQIYGRILEARSHIEHNLSATRVIAVHLNGMIEPARWNDEAVRYCRTSIAKRLVLMFNIMTVYLTEAKAKEIQAPSANMFMTEQEKIQFDEQFAHVQPGQSMHLRSVYLDLIGSLEIDFKKLVKLGVISPTPSMYGKLVDQAAQAVHSFSNSTRCIDMFRAERRRQTTRLFNHINNDESEPLTARELKKVTDAEATGETNLDLDPTKSAYPLVLTTVASVVLVYFCFISSCLIGCTVSVTVQLTNYGLVAEPISFFISLAFCSLYKITSEIEDPFGDDSLDFKLHSFGLNLAKDVASLLRVPSEEVDLIQQHASLHDSSYDKHEHAARSIAYMESTKDGKQA